MAGSRAQAGRRRPQPGGRRLGQNDGGYNQAVYSFMDEWGWNIAFVDAAMGSLLSEEEIERLDSWPQVPPERR